MEKKDTDRIGKKLGKQSKRKNDMEIEDAEKVGWGKCNRKPPLKNHTIFPPTRKKTLFSMASKHPS